MKGTSSVFMWIEQNMIIFCIWGANAVNNGEPKNEHCGAMREIL